VIFKHFDQAALGIAAVVLTAIQERTKKFCLKWEHQHVNDLGVVPKPNLSTYKASHILHTLLCPRGFDDFLPGQVVHFCNILTHEILSRIDSDSIAKHIE
jgi:hypothetical protein